MTLGHLSRRGLLSALALSALGFAAANAQPASNAKAKLNGRSNSQSNHKSGQKIKSKQKTKGKTVTHTAQSGIPFEPLLGTAIVKTWLTKAATAGVPESFSVPLLQTSMMQSVVKKYMDPPPAGSRKNWAAYKARFTDAYRIGLGQAFLREHASTFDVASAKYGVPPAVIAAIIGVETLYGKISGNFKLIDVLPTLAFDYPRRAEFFQGELLAFMQLVQAGTLSADTKGSFAGALGLPQFMPSSLQKWGVSALGGQRIDLATSAPDAITSVASFLAAHGWQRGLPIAFEAPAIDEASAGALLKADATPVYNFTTIAAFANAAVPRDAQFAVIDLQHQDLSHEYLLTTQNFHSLMQYNRSYFYASAVWYLAQRLGLPA